VVVCGVEVAGAAGRESVGAVGCVVVEVCSEAAVALVAPVELLVKMLVTLTSGV